MHHLSKEEAMTSPTTVNLVGDRELVIERSFDAPRELVWMAYTEPERIAQWFGPRGFTTDVLTMDVRPGGSWHYCMRSAEWGDAWGLARYREVVPPERLVYEDLFSNEEGTPADGMPVSTVTVTFTEQGGRTLMTSHTLFESAEDRDKTLEMGMEQGMTETLDRLEGYLASA
jgi:uncharacterized protein YndB with AHSA1/START domain